MNFSRRRRWVIADDDDDPFLDDNDLPATSRTPLTHVESSTEGDEEQDLSFTPTPRRSQRTASQTASQKLRSSRTTRNQDHANRNRGAVPDFDPTEGLPPRKWELGAIIVKQDASAEPGDQNTQTANEGFNTDTYPWPEQPLPSFYSQLSPLNQALVRAARTGNLQAKLPVWDSKTETWISSSEAEARASRLKSRHLQDVEVDASPEPEDDEDEHDENDDTFGDEDEDGRPRKRKLYNLERTFEAKKWSQVPFPQADKMEERKFLADRRPGMPTLYGAHNPTIIGGYSSTLGTTITGVDLGDGGGLGNASGILGTPAAQTPRKNMPPRRKKKKLGGPGRKKANPDAASTAPAGNVAPMEGVQTDGQERSQDNVEKPAVDGTKDEADEGSGSESEGEGSEEGEIDEGNTAEQDKPPQATTEEASRLPEPSDSLSSDQPEARGGTTEEKPETGELDLLAAVERSMKDSE